MWREEYASGNSEIDREHQELFQNGNALLDLAASRGTAQPELLEQAFDAFLQYIVGNFAQEEDMLRANGYANLPEHIEQHQRLLSQALELRKNIGTKGFSYGKLADFLANEMIVDHLLSEDRKYFELLQRATVGGKHGTTAQLDP